MAENNDDSVEHDELPTSGEILSLVEAGLEIYVNLAYQALDGKEKGFSATYIFDGEVDREFVSLKATRF